MKKTERRKKTGIRFVALAALASLVLGLTLTPPEAAAVTSLSGIEQIKSRGGTFTILEIVPQDGTGSIGYYVPGQEPTAGWMGELAEKTSRTERTNFANTLFNELRNREIMGAAGGDYPLTQTGTYQEWYPWETSIPADAVRLDLRNAEQVAVNGTFQNVGAGNGSYEQADTYEYAPGGGFMENVDYYVYGAKAGEDAAYYHALTFQSVDVNEENVTGFFDMPLYTFVEETAATPAHYVYAGTLREDSSDFTIDSDTTYYKATDVSSTAGLATTWAAFEKVSDIAGVPSGTTLYTRAAKTASYQVAGTVGADGFTPAADTVYYKASAGATPITAGTETALHSYYAQKNSAQPYLDAGVGNGYFKQIVGYRYVGEGQGNYSFTPGGSAPWTVVADTVYVSGGYTNNDWFKKYVLDMESDEFANVRVEVRSCTPDGVTDGLINIADLVVVSAGFDLSTGGTVHYTKDITSAQKDALAQKPRVVDARISGAANLASLGDGTAPCVTANNVYHFTTGSGSDARPALVTNLFYKAFDNDALIASNYKAVLDEIQYENQLRSAQGGGIASLPEEVSMATCIRYVINTHRVVNKKTAIKVLDIEPAPIYDQTDNNGPLTVATVRSWLPASANASNSDEYIETIDITHISTAALIGKIEDINEEYDLIYIGADLKGLNTTWKNGAEIVNYNDDSMDGLIYTNIGDTYTVKTILEGLLEKDYEVWTNGGNEIQAANDSKTYRFSGNDITPKKQTELMEFANAGLPIVVADALTLKTADQPKRTLSVSIQTGTPGRTSVSLTATPTVTPSGGNLTYEYQWYYWNGRRWAAGSTNASVTAYEGDQYYCVVTVTSAGVRYTARSETVRVINGWFLERTNNGESKNGYSLDIKLSGNALKATLSPSARDVEYKWYRNGDKRREGSSDSYTLERFREDDKYYCKAEVDIGYKEISVKSPTYQLKKGIDTEKNSSGKYDAVIPAVTGSDGLNVNRIDKCSLLYAALNSVWNKDNVLSEGELTSGTTMSDMQNTLVKHLNLSRPEINLTAMPNEYSGDLETTPTCDGTLSFTFTIENPTDATPAETKYTCRLYIDQNGDGRYTANEEISDLSVIGGENGQLIAGPQDQYTVQRTLSPKQFSGIVSWKLQVVKVGDHTVHASEKGYTYIHPDAPTPIKILQVRHTGVNLATQENFKVGDRTWRNNDEQTRDGKMLELYKDLKDAGAFDLNVFSMTVGELNDYASTEDGIYEYLSGFDMLVIGFGDCYGNFKEETANAVVRYIDTGKAILFTHDTTSFRNLPSANTKYWQNVYPLNSEGKKLTETMSYWGYYFNTILRDKVGLDRYGVTNTTYGLTKYFGQWPKYTDFSKVSGPVANGYSGADAAKLEEIKAAGYSIAYQPDSDFRTADETQGYTNYTLARFREGSDLLPTNGYGSYPNNGSGMTTTRVSQVNQGQITQFPYKLEKSLKVATTHEQYYQLNMNSDDIVVWYCLAADNDQGSNSFANGKNDVTNSYYIYNRGNVTYSGAGHFSSDTDKLAPSEAELFINTMVAAYRAGNGAPVVSYRTVDDSSNLSVQLIPMEYEGESGTGTSLGGNQTVCFKITDPNLTTQKTIKVDFFYEDEGGTMNMPLDGSAVTQAAWGNIYPANGGSPVTGSLRGNVLYKTVIPQSVLDAFDASGKPEMKLYIRATTTISGTEYIGYDVLTLKKLGLLRLE